MGDYEVYGRSVTLLLSCYEGLPARLKDNRCIVRRMALATAAGRTTGGRYIYN